MNSRSSSIQWVKARQSPSSPRWLRSSTLRLSATRPSYSRAVLRSLMARDMQRGKIYEAENDFVANRPVMTEELGRLDHWVSNITSRSWWGKNVGGVTVTLDWDTSRTTQRDACIPDGPY